MEMFITYEMIDQAAEVIRQRSPKPPRVGLILGSGLNGVADAVEADAVLSFEEIPHYAQATVEGHVGRLLLGSLEGQDVMVMQGRVHYYENGAITQVGLPVRVMQTLGVEILIVTNAAGGLNPDFQPGEVMVIRDHINLMGMAGVNPLQGPNLERFGPRFPDMSCPYDLALRGMALDVAKAADIPIQEGVYIGLAGPSFETPADIHFLRMIGVDAVGMSTVPEVTVARHGGTRVLGLSGISNVAVTEEANAGETTHEEVLEVGQLLAPRMETIIRGVLKRL